MIRPKSKFKTLTASVLVASSFVIGGIYTAEAAPVESMLAQNPAKKTSKATISKTAEKGNKTNIDKKQKVTTGKNATKRGTEKQVASSAATELMRDDSIRAYVDSICAYEKSRARDSILIYNKKAKEPQVAFPDPPSLSILAERGYDTEFVLINYLYQASGVKSEEWRRKQASPEQIVPLTNMLLQELQRKRSINTEILNGLHDQVNELLFTSVEVCVSDSLILQKEKQYLSDAILYYNNAQKDLKKREVIAGAEEGDDEAQYQMGSWFYHGENDFEQDYAKAVDYWKKAAEHQNAQAMAGLAECYEKGNGIQKDSAQAIKMYDEAVSAGYRELIEELEVHANRGNIFRQMYLAHCFLEGKGVDKNEQMVIKYYTMAANGGSRDAQYALGMYYKERDDKQNAIKYFKAASKHADATAMYWVGKLAMSVSQSEQDKQDAFGSLLRAADAGHIDALYEVSQCYMNGEGTTASPSSAVSFMKKAAVRGHAEAAWQLAHAFVKGNGVDTQYEQALYWFSKAVDAGHPCSVKEELQDIPNFLLYIEGMKLYILEKDYENATKKFKILEKAKNPMGTIMLGTILADVDNPERNAKKAVKMLEKVANTNPYASYQIGMIYDSSTEKNAELAIEYFQKSAEGNYGPALCRIGEYYYVGEDELIERSVSTAIKYFNAAWEQGRMTAKGVRRLSACYEKGNGIEADEEKAKELGKINVKDMIPSLLRRL